LALRSDRSAGQGNSVIYNTSKPASKPAPAQTPAKTPAPAAQPPAPSNPNPKPQ
jgi:hypothetical protein